MRNALINKVTGLDFNPYETITIYESGRESISLPVLNEYIPRTIELMDIRDVVICVAVEQMSGYSPDEAVLLANTIYNVMCPVRRGRKSAFCVKVVNSFTADTIYQKEQ